jgi:Skp family chaperone for outer membrane proteins
MRGSAIAASLALSVMALSAAPIWARTASEQANPAQTAPKPAQPTPAQPTPAQPTAKPAQPAPAPAQQPLAQPAAPSPQPPAQPPAPFPQGAKIAYINPQLIFQQSAEGKTSVARVQALVQKKQTEGAAKAKQLQDNQTKLQSSGSVMNEAARSQLEKEIERQQREGERFQQDAQAEINEIQQEVNSEFMKKVQPIIDQIATEKGLHFVFNAVDAGLAWAAPGLDISADVIKKLDSATKPAAAPKQ